MTTTLAHRVVTGLKEQILSGRLAPGAKLPSEAELIDEFAVSRTVVREAVTRLRAEGLVETFQGRGSFVLAVPEPSPFAAEAASIRTHDDVLAMVDFRIGIESEAAALAAHNRSATDESAIRAAGAEFTRAGAEGGVAADFAFHRAVAQASGNRYFRDLVESLGPTMIMLARTRLGDSYSMSDAAHVQRVAREHEAIADAVLAGDADGARAAMRVHLGSTRRRLGG
ncbi:FadR family transcriptional regulator [Janibacter sp. YIM B02568]|uniref:FadR/GntR family transcriptional regulator n=1 Tax=Janibacter endophyticus TaxID=2806261 RepID=UPI0019524243|nr:FadR/GntR family transcriptional regulator [Janibacter endophyticus]MBM6545102.1 FadR family transcriptional regulator [Janibacter endophyticus]